MYNCLCESGKDIQNECVVNTLSEVVQFVDNLCGYKMTIIDFDNLIQIKKFEHWYKRKGINERIVITYTVD